MENVGNLLQASSLPAILDTEGVGDHASEGESLDQVHARIDRFLALPRCKFVCFPMPGFRLGGFAVEMMRRSPPS
uniref:Uncharacterized protein n=1 Tax=Physcomitrium patens TaxID=3218 RepID=A0A2K1K3G6_PHYPA|nr:hypothetical protein PHYPA_012792 [Physcomitrium patens]